MAVSDPAELGLVTPINWISTESPALIAVPVVTVAMLFALEPDEADRAVVALLTIVPLVLSITFDELPAATPLGKVITTV